jgi:hypothetical protein
MALPMPPAKPKKSRKRSTKGRSLKARKPHVKRARKSY